MIGIKLYKNEPNDMAKYTEVAIWCNQNNATIQDNGDFYEVVEISKPTDEEVYKMEAESVKLKLKEQAINAMMFNLAGNDLSIQQEEYQISLANITDNIALFIPEVFPIWSGNSILYKKDVRVTYENVLYKVITEHTSQETWTPKDSPSLFVKVIISEGEILDWEQPSAENAYKVGDKVRFEGKIYISLIDGNVWSPKDFPQGWQEVKENENAQE